MKILMWTHKHGAELYDASTPEKELSAWKLVFDIMDEQGDFECCPPEGKEQKDWYKKAKKGDKALAKRLLQWRSNNDYEYEHFDLCDVQDPDAVGEKDDELSTAS